MDADRGTGTALTPIWEKDEPAVNRKNVKDNNLKISVFIRSVFDVNWRDYFKSEKYLMMTYSYSCLSYDRVEYG